MEGTSEIETPSARDWSKLDEHFARCPTCRADYEELLRTRRMLLEVAEDSPTNTEIETMWTAIQTALPIRAAALLAVRRPILRRVPWSMVASVLATAACLAGAFLLGKWHYEATRPNEATQVARLRYSLSPEGERSAGTFRTFGSWLLSRDGSKASGQSAAPSSGEEIARLGLAEHRRLTTEAHGKDVATDQSVERLGAGEYFAHAGVQAEGVQMRGVSSVSLSGGAETVEKGGARFDAVQQREGRTAQLPQETVERLASLGYVASSAPKESPTAGAGRFVFGTEFKPLPPPQVGKPPEKAGVVEHYADTSRSLGELALTPGTEARGRVLDHAGDGVVDADETRLLLHEQTAEQPSYGAAVASAQPVASATDKPTPAPAEQAPPPQAPQAAPASPSEPKESQTPKAVQAPPSASRAESKIIKTGELGVEVEEYESAVERVYAIVSQHGASVADGSTQEQTGGALLGRVVIRVAPERFAALFAALKSVGRIESENVKAADVTAEYVDLEARIHTLQITEDRLRELIQSKSFMDKIASLLEVERELTRVRTQIEQLQGQLRVMADRVAMSTITLTLREPVRTVPSASLSVEVPVLADAEAALGTALTDLSGRLTSGKTSKREDGTLMGNYTLQVSLARFGDLLAGIEGLGRVQERQVKDRQFGDAAAPWAAKVTCQLALLLYERSRQLPQGTLSLEVNALPAAIEQLDGVVSDAGGSILSNRTTRRDDGSSAAEVSIRVPAGAFADLLARVEPLGRTTSKQVIGEAGRIVGGAANVPRELNLALAERPRQVPTGHMMLEVARFPAAREQLSGMIAEKAVQVLGSSSEQRTDGTWIGGFRLGIKAADMEAVVTRLESLGRVASRQVLGLGLGDLSKADPDALGVIELTLAEPSAISPEPGRAGESIRRHLRDALAGLYSSLGLMLYGLILLAPWAVIVLLVVWLVVRQVRRRRGIPAPSAPVVAQTPPSKP